MGWGAYNPGRWVGDADYITNYIDVLAVEIRSAAPRLSVLFIKQLFSSYPHRNRDVRSAHCAAYLRGEVSRPRHLAFNRPTGQSARQVLAPPHTHTHTPHTHTHTRTHRRARAHTSSLASDARGSLMMTPSRLSTATAVGACAPGRRRMRTGHALRRR